MTTTENLDRIDELSNTLDVGHNDSNVTDQTTPGANPEVVEILVAITRAFQAKKAYLAALDAQAANEGSCKEHLDSGAGLQVEFLTYLLQQISFISNDVTGLPDDASVRAAVRRICELALE